jgi:hypothetical protein
VAREVRLPYAFQVGARLLQDVISHAQVPGDPRDWRHAKVHQDFRDIPHQDRQPPGLGNALHFGLLKPPLELNKLHQLLTVILGVEAPGLRLHYCRLTQAEVSLSPIELDLLLPQHHVDVEGVFGAGSVRLHLVEVLLSSSLGFCLLNIKVSANLD